MNIDAFWTMIERSGHKHADEFGRTRWLQTTLAQLRAPAIIDFAILLDQTRRRADQWVMWGAANLIMSGTCSGDSFFYFQPWLIGLGRETFEQVVVEPDLLAEVPNVRRLADHPRRNWGRDDSPQWEALNYVPHYAYQRLLGDDAEIEQALDVRGYRRRSDPRPTGPDSAFYDPAETVRRLPRLAALFHNPAGG